MTTISVLFYLFSAVLLASSFGVITARSTVHAALFLVLAFFNAACLWMMLKAEFLAIALVLVYVGAVMVLFLFVVMMLDVNTDSLRVGFWKHLPLAGLVGAVIALEMALVLMRGFRLEAPLPTVKAAKFYEVTKQIVLTSHLVDALFIAISSKTLKALSPANQQKVLAAAQAASAYNNDNRIKEEALLVEFFKKEGLQITTPDLDAFHKTVQAAYQNSDYAKVWPKGLLERINATK